MSGLEIPGFVVGVAGLLGLFSTCVQGLDLIETASNMEKDAHISLTKFENAKHLLKEWGQAVGLKITDGAVDPSHHPNLDLPHVLSQVGLLLGTVTLMFLDADKLSKKYGVSIPQNAQPTDGILSLKDLKKAITEGATSTGKTTSLWRKTRWAISNKKQFGNLADEISAFVDKFYQIINPVEDLMTSQLQKVKSSVDVTRGDIQQATTMIEASFNTMKSSIDDTGNKVERARVAVAGGIMTLQSSINETKSDIRLVRQDIEARLEVLRSVIEDDAKQRADAILDTLLYQLKMDTYIQSERREKLLAWLEAASTESEYAEALQARHEGTCTWITQNETFLEWKNQESQALWIHGGAGMGKTFVSASIVEFLKRTSAFPVAYFFCRHDDPRKSNTNSILRSWIHQLATQRVEALKIVEKSKEGEPIIGRLWKIFQQILNCVDCCYLVIDGLDECLDYDATARNYELGAVERFLSQLQQHTSTRTKILVISRDQPSIRSGLQDAAKYAISKEDTANDIKSYASAFLDKAGIKQSKTREDSLNRMCTGCDGMFLLVRLQGSRLTPRMTAREIQKTFSSMPSNLDEAYKRDLLSISELGKETHDQARDIFRWVLFTVRPLSVRELLHLLAVDDTDETFPDDNIPDPIDDECIRYRILDICQSFVTVTAEPSSVGDGKVQFAHFSAKEYLLNAENYSVMQKKHPNLADFFFPTPGIHHSILTRSCLLYLLLALQLEDIELDVVQYPVTSWMKHLQNTPEDLKHHSIGLQKKLFTPGMLFNNWKDLTYTRSSFYDSRGLVNMSSTPLGIASYYGFSDLCKALLSDLSVGVLNLSDLNHALFLALYKGHPEIVQLLLAAGADANAEGKNGLTPLNEAAKRDHPKIVQLLLAAGADANAMDVRGSTPLHKADHPEVVKLLLAAGADANAEIEDGSTPLQKTDNPEVVQLLLAAGADAKAASKYGWTSLHTVAASGHQESIKLLLAAGADANAANKYGRTSLHIAAASGHQEVIKLLLAAGADANAANKGSSTPLHEAAREGHQEVIKLLLAARADAKAVNCYDSTPLQEAAREGHQEVIKLLLAARADAKAVNWYGPTPLHPAIVSFKPEVVKPLLATGANKNITNGHSTHELPTSPPPVQAPPHTVPNPEVTDFMDKGGLGKEVVPLLLVSEGMDAGVANIGGRVSFLWAVSGLFIAVFLWYLLC